ncbi:MAG: hypothetical protein AAGG51_30305 [Cyanobacteria bacterium P01_G01_bin.54]
MPGPLQHLEQLEQDLARYRQQFQDSDEVLTTLTTIKQDFALLTQYYTQTSAAIDTQRIEPEVISNGAMQAVDTNPVDVNGLGAASVPPLTPTQLVMLQERLAYALVQLEHYVTEQNRQTQALVEQRLGAIEASVQHQMSLFRQHILLSLAQLEDKQTAYLETQLAPLEATQTALHGSLETLETQVTQQDAALYDLQATVSDRLDSLHSGVQGNQDQLQWLAIGGILLSLLLLLLPLGLQWRNELHFQQLDLRPVGEPGQSVEP